MTNLISHPFRVSPTGSIAVADDASEGYLAERIALLMTIREGERPLVSDFGLGDLEFQGVIESALTTQVELWGIPVVITSVKEDAVDDASVNYTIEFEVDTEAENA